MKKLLIKIVNTKRNKYGARKYAYVPSATKEGDYYLVLKIRKRDKKHYKYICSCPHNMNTQRQCKHITAFILTEQSMGVKGVL